MDSGFSKEIPTLFPGLFYKKTPAPNGVVSSSFCLFLQHAEIVDEVLFR
jgi:hypothetical protein